MKYIISIGFLFFLISCIGQSKHLKLLNKNTSSEEYSDFILLNQSILALTTKGGLIKFNRESGVKEIIDLNLKFTNLSFDKNKNIIVSDTNNVYKVQNSKVEKLFQSTYPIKGIVFNNENSCFLITENGILNTKNDSLYFPDSSFNSSGRSNRKWYKKPTYLIDQYDNIWIGFGYGEWGGDLFIFNTKSQSYIKPNLDSFYVIGRPITSIIEGDNNIYVGSGLMHFMTSGSIASFESFKSRKIFESDSYGIKYQSNDFVQGEYIGPIYFLNDYLYFYSQNGIFKGNIKKDLTKLKNWTLLFKPKLKWRNGQSDAVGSPMNLLKLIVLENDEIIFLSEADGLGIYKNKKLKMTK